MHSDFCKLSTRYELFSWLSIVSEFPLTLIFLFLLTIPYGAIYSTPYTASVPVAKCCTECTVPAVTAHSVHINS